LKSERIPKSGRIDKTFLKNLKPAQLVTYSSPRPSFTLNGKTNQSSLLGLLVLFVLILLGVGKRIFDQIRKLIMAQLQDGRRVPELISIFKSVCKRSTLYSVAEHFAAGVREKPRKERLPRQGKVTPKMVKRMTFLLTAFKSRNSFRSIAKKLQIDESTVRYQMRKRRIKSHKKL
jgi:hypothetical protein